MIEHWSELINTVATLLLALGLITFSRNYFELKSLQLYPRVCIRVLDYSVINLATFFFEYLRADSTFGNCKLYLD